MQLAIDTDTLVLSFPAVLINDHALSPVRWHTYCQLHANTQRHALQAYFVCNAVGLSAATLEVALFTFTLSLPGSEKIMK